MSNILAFPHHGHGPNRPVAATGEQIDAGLGEAANRRSLERAPHRGRLDENLRNLHWSIGSLVVKLNELSAAHPGLVAGTERSRGELAALMSKIRVLRDRLDK